MKIDNGVKMNKIVYVLNQYKSNEASHFYHVINLLKEMSALNVSVCLIIEKGDEAPEIFGDNMEVILQHRKNPVARFFELIYIIRKKNLEGYKKVFVRISTYGALASCVAKKISGGQVYYWNSGTTIEDDNSKPFGIKKIKWYIKSRLPFIMVKESVDFFVTGPEKMVDYYVNNAKVKREKMVVLYNDIDTSRFLPIDTKEKNALKYKYKVKNQEKIILFVHRLSPVKRTLYYLPYILDIVFSNEKIKNKLKFIIVGDGEDKEILCDAINSKSYKNSVVMTGNIPNKEVHELYQVADIFMNPTYEEGFPRVLLEAMASGLPVVTTDAGGISDLLGNKQLSYMVDKNDREDFAIKLINLICNEDICIDLMRENLTTVKKFSTKNVAKMYINKIFSN